MRAYALLTCHLFHPAERERKAEVATAVHTHTFQCLLRRFCQPEKYALPHDNVLVSNNQRMYEQDVSACCEENKAQPCMIHRDGCGLVLCKHTRKTEPVLLCCFIGFLSGREVNKLHLRWFIFLYVERTLR